jgi:hypothetical protein
LEPRLYLSGGLLGTAVGTALDRLGHIADVAVLRSPDDQADMLLVDLNGAANSDDALLATFDADTGRLIAALPVAGGQLVITNSIVDGRTDGLAQRIDDAANMFTPAPGPAGLRTATAQEIDGDGNMFTAARANEFGAFPYFDFRVVTIARDEQISGNSLDRHTSLELASAESVGNEVAVSIAPTQDNTTPAVMAEAAPPAQSPIVVAFPAGTLPHDFNVFDAVAADDRPSAQPSQRPVSLVIAPGSFEWLSRLSGSPWHSRALERSSVDRLLGSGLGGDLAIDQAGGEFDGLSRGTEFTSSRVLLRSPVRTLVFKTPAELGRDGRSAGAELAAYNFATGQLTRTGRVVIGPLVAAGGRVAFLSPAAAADLTADGAIDEQVLQVFDPATGGVRTTSLRAAAIRSVGGQLIVAVSEPNRAASPSAPALPGNRFSYYAYDVASGRLTGLRVAADWTWPAGQTVPSATERTAQAVEPRTNESAETHGRVPWRSNPAAAPMDDRGRAMPPTNVAFSPAISPPADPPKPVSSTPQHAQDSSAAGPSGSAPAASTTASDGAGGGEE